MYTQLQPPSAFLLANINAPVKTSDGGFIFSCNPTDANIPNPILVDYITVRTNPNFIPQWRRRNYSKITALPSGGIISIYLNSSNKAIIDKQTSSGQVIWSKEIKGPNTLSNSIVYTSISDAIGYGNKLRVIGTTFLTDFNGLAQNIEAYTAEFDTSTGTVISANKFLSTTSSSLNSQPFYYNNIFRDSQGSFYLVGSSKAGLTKFSSNFTFMWQLSWISAVNNPFVNAIKFAGNGDLFCTMSYYDTIAANYTPGIMRVTNPATIVFEKKMQNMLGFSGLDNMPSGNFMLSYIKKQSVSDTLKTHLLAVDGSANLLWHKSYHQSLAVSPPLALGNGEYLLSSMSSKTSSNTAQNPIAFTVDQFGNSACTSLTLNAALSSYTSSPVLGTVAASPITLTVTNAATVNVSFQTFKDTCGGAQLGLLGLAQFALQNEFEFWPNPASYKLFLAKNSIEKQVDVCFVNIAGQTIKTLNVEGDEVDLSGLAPGIYFVKFRSKNQILGIKKLIISREN